MDNLCHNGGYILRILYKLHKRDNNKQKMAKFIIVIHLHFKYA